MASPKDNVSMSALGQLYDAVWTVSEEQAKKTGKAPDFVVGEVSDYVAQGIGNLADTMTMTTAAASGVNKLVSDYANSKFGVPKISITDIFPTYQVAGNVPPGMQMPKIDEDVFGSNDYNPGARAEAKLEMGVNDLITNPRGVADAAADAYIASLEQVRKIRMMASIGRAVQEGLNYLEMKQEGIPNDIAATIVNAQVWDRKPQEAITTPTKVRINEKGEMLSQSMPGGTETGAMAIVTDATTYAPPSDKSILDVIFRPNQVFEEIRKNGIQDAFAKLDAEQLADRKAELARTKLDAVMANSIAMRAGVLDNQERADLADTVQRRLMPEFVKEYNKEAATSTVLKKNLDPTKFADDADKLLTDAKSFYDPFNIRYKDDKDKDKDGKPKVKNYFATISESELFNASDKGEAPGHALQRAWTNALGEIRKDPNLSPAVKKHLDNMMYQAVDEKDFHSFISTIGKSLGAGEATTMKMGKFADPTKAKEAGRAVYENTYESKYGATPSSLAETVKESLSRLQQQAAAAGNTKLANGLAGATARVGVFNENVDKAGYALERIAAIGSLNNLITPAMVLFGDSNGFKRLVDVAGLPWGVGPVSSVGPWAPISPLAMFGKPNAGVYKLTPDETRSYTGIFDKTKSLLGDGSDTPVKLFSGMNLDRGKGMEKVLNLNAAEKLDPDVLKRLSKKYNIAPENIGFSEIKIKNNTVEEPKGFLNWVYRRKADGKDENTGKVILDENGKRMQVWSTLGNTYQFGSVPWGVTSNANGVQKKLFEMYVNHPVNQFKGKLNGTYYQQRLMIDSDYGTIFGRNKDLSDAFKEKGGWLHNAISEQHLVDGKGKRTLYGDVAHDKVNAFKKYLDGELQKFNGKAFLTATDTQRINDLNRAKKMLASLEKLADPKYREWVMRYEKFQRIIGLPNALQKKVTDKINEKLKEIIIGKIWEEWIKQLMIKAGFEVAANAIGAVLTGGSSLVVEIVITVVVFLADVMTLGYASKIGKGIIKLTFELVIAIILFFVAIFVFVFTGTSGIMANAIGLGGGASLYSYATFFGLGNAALWIPDSDYHPTLANRPVDNVIGGPGQNCDANGNSVPVTNPIEPKFSPTSGATGEYRNARGIDVSHWNGSMDWGQVKNNGIEFAIIKATEGTGFKDDKFNVNFSSSKGVGIKRTAYHFFLPDIDGYSQANYFMNYVYDAGHGDFGDFQLAVDIELTSYMNTKCGPQAAANNLKAFLDQVEHMLGYKAIIYTSAYMWSAEVGNPSWGGDAYPLWVAAWNKVGPSTLPSGWSKWVIWQCYDKGVIPGNGSKSMDLNRWYPADGGCWQP